MYIANINEEELVSGEFGDFSKLLFSKFSEEAEIIRLWKSGTKYPLSI